MIYEKCALMLQFLSAFIFNFTFKLIDSPGISFEILGLNLVNNMNSLVILLGGNIFFVSSSVKY